MSIVIQIIVRAIWSLHQNLPSATLRLVYEVMEESKQYR